LASVEIVPVEGGRSAREFLEFPYRLYRGDPYWVPPPRTAQKRLFDTRHHPFYREAEMQRFLALCGGRIAGRVAAILHFGANGPGNRRTGSFGFLEMENRLEVAQALLDAAEGWLRAKGVTVIRGPMNPSTNYECGMLVEGFDSSPFILMTYNPPYYPELIERTGWRKARDLYAYRLEQDGAAIGKAREVASRALQRFDIRVRSIRMNCFESEVEAVWRVYNQAWSRNWGFLPMSRGEFEGLARDLRTVLVPDLVLLGEARGRIVGFLLAVPDINRALKLAGGRLFPFGLIRILHHKRFIRSLRVMAMGVEEGYRNAGVAAGFYVRLLEQGVRLGYTEGEFSWVLEDNVMMNRSILALGGRKYKTYRIYERD
jgi:hypothetical protein